MIFFKTIKTKQIILSILIVSFSYTANARDNYSLLNDTIAIQKIGEGESLNIGVAMGILLYQLTK